MLSFSVVRFPQSQPQGGSSGGGAGGGAQPGFLNDVPEEDDDLYS